MRCPLWCEVDVCGAHCGVKWMYAVPTVVWSGCMRVPAGMNGHGFYAVRSLAGRPAICYPDMTTYTVQKTWEKFSSLTNRKAERIWFKSHVRDSCPHISRFIKALKNYPFFDSAIGDHPQFSADCCGGPIPLPYLPHLHITH
jgi:hypothetical protein